MFIGFLLVLVGSPMGGMANAHPNTLDDPRGDAEPSPLDIESVVQNHQRFEGKRFVSFRVNTYDPFTSEELRAVGDEHFAISIFLFTGDNRGSLCQANRSINVGVQPDSQAPDGLSPVAFVVRGGCAKPSGDTGKPPSGKPTLGYAQIWRPTANSVKVRVPVSLIKKESIRAFRWRARTESEQRSGDSATITPDFAPELPKRLARGHL
jgi:hypothetical protein